MLKFKKFSESVELDEEASNLHTVYSDISESDGGRYGVFSKGGSIGQNSNKPPVKMFSNADEAKEYAKRMRAALSPGERNNYGMSYIVKKVNESVDLDEANVKKGDSVKIINAKKYDALSKPEVSGIVIGMLGSKVMVKVGSGQMNVDAKDIVKESVDLDETYNDPTYIKKTIPALRNAVEFHKNTMKDHDKKSVKGSPEYVRAHSAAARAHKEAAERNHIAHAQLSAGSKDVEYYVKPARELGAYAEKLSDKANKLKEDMDYAVISANSSKKKDVKKVEESTLVSEKVSDDDWVHINRVGRFNNAKKDTIIGYSKALSDPNRAWPKLKPGANQAIRVKVAKERGFSIKESVELDEMKLKNSDAAMNLEKEISDLKNRISKLTPLAVKDDDANMKLVSAKNRLKQKQEKYNQLMRESVELDEAKSKKYYNDLMKFALKKAGRKMDPDLTSSFATNGDFIVSDRGVVVARLKKGTYPTMKESVELEEATGIETIKAILGPTKNSKEGIAALKKKLGVSTKDATDMLKRAMKEDVKLDEASNEGTIRIINLGKNKGFQVQSMTNGKFVNVGKPYKDLKSAEEFKHLSYFSQSMSPQARASRAARDLLNKESVELDEAKLPVAKIQKMVDDGKSMDVIVGTFANRLTTNTDEIRKVVKDYMWKKRMKKESVELGESPFDAYKRDFKSREMDYELRDEKPDSKGKKHIVTIKGKAWKTFASHDQALKAARTLTNKGVQASVRMESVDLEDVKLHEAGSPDRLAIIKKAAQKVKAQQAAADKKAMRAAKRDMKSPGAQRGMAPVMKDIDEAKGSKYDMYHKDFSTAVQYARKEVEKQGYEIDDEEWFRKVGSGPKKPSVGKTNKYSIDLMKNDKDVKQKLNMQVYGMDNGKYELNMYVS
jgi:hypothetical protein